MSPKEQSELSVQTTLHLSSRLPAGRPAAELQMMSARHRLQVAAGDAGLQPSTNCFFHLRESTMLLQSNQANIISTITDSLAGGHFVTVPWGCMTILRDDLIGINSGGDTEKMMDFTLCPSLTLTHFCWIFPH